MQATCRARKGHDCYSSDSTMFADHGVTRHRTSPCSQLSRSISFMSHFCFRTCTRLKGPLELWSCDGLFKKSQSVVVLQGLGYPQWRGIFHPFAWYRSRYGESRGEVLRKHSRRVSGTPGGKILRPRWQSLQLVPTENSIALKKREQHSRGNEFLGLRKHLSNRRVLNDPPYRLPEQRFTAAGCVHVVKRKRLAQAARRWYRWCSPPTCGSSMTRPISGG
jgi:hypothetical protein